MMELNEYINWIWDQYESGQINETQMNYLVESQGIPEQEMTRVYNLRQTYRGLKIMFVCIVIFFLMRFFIYR